MKLLVVEDDHDTSEGVCEYFREAGYEVTAAYDGGEALDLVRQNSFDLIVLDVMLPKLNGGSLCSMSCAGQASYPSSCLPLSGTSICK